ncbi:aspartate/glutamate racemase family protein [Alkalibacter saccharofermentans]|uniref:Aspartate racemase n=1 Tax=Alkalibacter saccharofermentans DSM 14828 TaxID=1120975 RepID=A0A1M4ZT70_9FIRM|nr:amino acid racemase [Alkalibacter saccharofermentans]SHF20766.1 aspartate racemase [Alkalibacter saccharofermentans DSM 14828]
MKTLGVIGGTGPLATSYFFERIVLITDAKSDQDHIDVILYNRPSMPDRTGYITGKSKVSPVVPMIEIGSRLADQGADYIAIPCITAHSFFNELSEGIDVPIINFLEETGNHIEEEGIRNVGLMATDGTVFSGMFQNTLMNKGIEAILPSKKAQSYVMDIIYRDIKSGKSVDTDKLAYVVGELKDKHVDGIILGCTELSLLKKGCAAGREFIDPLEIAAEKAVALCGGKVKKSLRHPGGDVVCR